MSFFEDIVIGETAVVGRHTFTADGIKAFARRYDPQLFHVDEDAAARSHFGALCASGWQTAIVWMRLMLDYRRAADDALDRGTVVQTRAETTALFNPPPSCPIPATLVGFLPTSPHSVNMPPCPPPSMRIKPWN